jgi:hypothetical protein
MFTIQPDVFCKMKVYNERCESQKKQSIAALRNAADLIRGGEKNDILLDSLPIKSQRKLKRDGKLEIVMKMIINLVHKSKDFYKRKHLSLISLFLFLFFIY